MGPFARTLAPAEVSELASYLSELPDTPTVGDEVNGEERAEGASLYAEHCAEQGSRIGLARELHDAAYPDRPEILQYTFIQRKQKQKRARWGLTRS